MKKCLAVAGFLAIPALFLSKDVRADGLFTPVLVVSTNTNQGFLYPQTQVPAAGGVLVNNAGGLFNWSNAAIVSTTVATSQQFISLPLITAAQELQLTAATTGQLVFCTNCANMNSGLGGVCVSTGSTKNSQFVVVSSATALTTCQ